MMSDNVVDSQAKSSVRPNGVPSSSFRAYRLPIEVLESSTREKTPALRSFEASVEELEGRRHNDDPLIQGEVFKEN